MYYSYLPGRRNDATRTCWQGGYTVFFPLRTYSLNTSFSSKEYYFFRFLWKYSKSRTLFTRENTRTWVHKATDLLLFRFTTFHFPLSLVQHCAHWRLPIRTATKETSWLFPLYLKLHPQCTKKKQQTNWRPSYACYTPSPTFSDRVHHWTFKDVT